VSGEGFGWSPSWGRNNLCISAIEKEGERERWRRRKREKENVHSEIQC
jgi:hypothetical protein